MTSEALPQTFRIAKLGPLLRQWTFGQHGERSGLIRQVVRLPGARKRVYDSLSMALPLCAACLVSRSFR
jgi:hypothetical protein